MAVKKDVRGDLFKKRFHTSGTSEPVRWKFADKDLVFRLIDAVVACGGLVSFSSTMDRTSFVITFLHDHIAKEDRKWYVGNAETINENLLHWVDTWEGLLEELEDSKSSQKG